MNKTGQLNARQWALAQYLEDMFHEDERTVVTKEMICANFPDAYPRLGENCDEHNSSVYRLIRADINEIKNCDQWFHILITYGNIGYKIATLEEAKKCLEKEKVRAIRILNICSKMKRKIRADRQVVLPLDDLHAQIVIETFLGD